MFKIFISPLNKMNHFDEMLREGQSLIHHHYHQNQQLYDKSTNQSNPMATVNEQIHSPFDSSPKASMFFFSLNSPRQNADNFHFNQLSTHSRKNSKDHIQPINRRLEFEEDASLFCQQEEIEEQEVSVKEEEPWNFESSECVPKSKKIKKSKNSKGLKNLSIGVYDIVAEKTQTTYKEVANCLIEKISRKAKEEANQDQGFEQIRKIQKDQHNIKRRVYDALNVLISAQLLRKEGKKVICNYNLKQEHTTKQFLEQERQKACSEVAMREEVLAEKRQALMRLQSQQQKLKALFRKNKQLGARPANSINLPFIAAKTSSQDIEKFDMGKRDVLIEFRGNIVIMGDIDTLFEIEN